MNTNTNIYLYADLQGLSDTLTELHDDIDQYLTDERGLHQLFLDCNEMNGSGKATANLEESVFGTLGMDQDQILERFDDIREQITHQDKTKAWHPSVKKVELLSLSKLLILAGEIYGKLKEFLDHFDIGDKGKKFKSWVNKYSEEDEQENLSYETKMVRSLHLLTNDLICDVEDFLAYIDAMTKAGLIKELDRE
nr:hypothetical protein [Limosilactobacillus mucosae]